LNISKKEALDLLWDQGLSKQGVCTVTEDPKVMRVHSNTCYTHFVTNMQFKEENFYVEIELNVQQTDDYFYIGIVNETYNYASNCMCCNPPNAFYVQCNGSIHINAQTHNNNSFAWRSEKTIMGIKVLLSEKKIYFMIPDKVEAGPYNITGNSFRVVSGHCNTGNGTLTILSCEETS